MNRTLAIAFLFFTSPLLGQDTPPEPPAKREEIFRTLMECDIHRLADEFEEFGGALDSNGVTTDACSAADALKRAAAWLEGNGAKEAVATLKGAGQRVDELTGIAGAAAAKGNLVLAIAALLDAHEREPQNAGVLANLAAALSPVGLCAEAIAIAEAAEPLAKGKTGAMGLPVGCIALNARGHALIRQGRNADAVKPLREAVALGGPLASDAARNLAYALKKASEEEESKRVFLMACWRRPVPKPICYGGKKRKQGDPARGPFDKDVSTCAPARLLFDLSHGKPGKLPTFGQPQDIKAVKTFFKFVERESKESAEAMPKDAAVKKPNGKALGDRRASHVFHMINMIRHDPDVEPLYQAMEEGQDELKKQTKSLHEATLKKAMEIIKAGGDGDAIKAKLRANTQEAISEANGYCNTYESLVRKYWETAYRVKTGLVANIKSPGWHAYAMADIRGEMRDVWHLKLLLPTVGAYAAALSGGGTEEKEGELGEREGLLDEDIPACPPGLQGCGVEFGAGPLSFSMSCESVGIEVSSAGPLKGFVSLEATWKGQMTVYAGAKLEVGGHGLPGFTATDGIYVTGNQKDGVTDAGFRVGAEAFYEAGGMKVKTELGKMDFSLMPSVK